MYGDRLASVLTGVTPSQLRSWRSKGILVPEISPFRPPLYSFRDLAALRTIARLRGQASAQKIAKAFENLPMIGLIDHPAEYRFGYAKPEIYVEGPDGIVVGLAHSPGSVTLYTFEDISESFKNFRGDEVADFRRPSEFVELDPHRMSGMPTVAGTRVDIETVLALVDPQEAESIDEFVEDYPGVTREAIVDVLRFDQRVRTVA